MSWALGSWALGSNQGHGGGESSDPFAKLSENYKKRRSGSSSDNNFVNEWAHEALKLCDSVKEPDHRAKLLRYAFKLNQWKVVVRILSGQDSPPMEPLPMSNQRAAFRELADENMFRFDEGGDQAIATDFNAFLAEERPEGYVGEADGEEEEKEGYVEVPAPDPTNSHNGHARAAAFIVCLAVKSGRYDIAIKYLDHADITCWMLVECIKSRGGPFLLEKLLKSRDGKVMWRTWDCEVEAEVNWYEKQETHDQMAYMGNLPRHVVKDSMDTLECHNNEHKVLVHELLPDEPKFMGWYGWLGVKFDIRKKVPASVSVFAVRGVCCQEMIEALLRAPDEAVLETDAAYAILSAAWRHVVWPYFVDTVKNIVYICFLFWATHEVRFGGTTPWICMLFFVLATLKDIAEELFQWWCTRHRSHLGGGVEYMVRKFCAYFFTMEQFRDWTFILLDVLGIYGLYGYIGSASARRRAFLALWSICRWTKTLFGLRGYHHVGPHMLPILGAIGGVLDFMIITGFFIGGAWQAYYVLALQAEPSAWYGALLQVLLISLFGDFDLHSFEGESVVYKPASSGSGVLEPQDPDPTEMYEIVHILFFFIAFVILVLLMSLLVGILGSNYDEHQGSSMAKFLRCRAFLVKRYMYSSIHSLFSTKWPKLDDRALDADRRSLTCWNTENACRQDTSFQHGYLWVASRQIASQNKYSSMRENLRKLEKRVGGRLQNIEEIIENAMDERLKAEKTMDKRLKAIEKSQEEVLKYLRAIEQRDGPIAAQDSGPLPEVSPSTALVPATV